MGAQTSRGRRTNAVGQEEEGSLMPTKLDEVSSVDRGANELARVLISKRDITTADKLDMAFDALYESCASIIADDNVDKFEALDETLSQAEAFVKAITEEPVADDLYPESSRELSHQETNMLDLVLPVAKALASGRIPSTPYHSKQEFFEALQKFARAGRRA
jgi:hypothetical protein